MSPSAEGGDEVGLGGGLTTETNFTTNKRKRDGGDQVLQNPVKYALDALARAENSDPRPAQKVIVPFVVGREAYWDRELILVEAGCGSGKSAMCLASYAHGVNEKGDRLLIVEPVRQLMYQMYLSARRYYSESRVSVLYGKSNYVCVHTLQKSLEDLQGATFKSDEMAFKMDEMAFKTDKMAFKIDEMEIALRLLISAVKALPPLRNEHASTACGACSAVHNFVRQRALEAANTDAVERCVEALCENHLNPKLCTECDCAAPDGFGCEYFAHIRQEATAAPVLVVNTKVLDAYKKVPSHHEYVRNLRGRHVVIDEAHHFLDDIEDVCTTKRDLFHDDAYAADPNQWGCLQMPRLCEFLRTPRKCRSFKPQEMSRFREQVHRRVNSDHDNLVQTVKDSVTRALGCPRPSGFESGAEASLIIKDWWTVLYKALCSSGVVNFKGDLLNDFIKNEMPDRELLFRREINKAALTLNEEARNLKNQYSKSVEIRDCNPKSPEISSASLRDLRSRSRILANASDQEIRDYAADGELLPRLMDLPHLERERRMASTLREIALALTKAGQPPPPDKDHAAFVADFVAELTRYYETEVLQTVAKMASHMVLPSSDPTNDMYMPTIALCNGNSGCERCANQAKGRCVQQHTVPHYDAIVKRAADILTWLQPEGIFATSATLRCQAPGATGQQEEWGIWNDIADSMGRRATPAPHVAAAFSPTQSSLWTSAETAYWGPKARGYERHVAFCVDVLCRTARANPKCGTLFISFSNKLKADVLGGLRGRLASGEGDSFNQIAVVDSVEEHKTAVDRGIGSVLVGGKGCCAGVDLPGGYLTALLFGNAYFIPGCLRRDILEFDRLRCQHLKCKTPKMQGWFDYKQTNAMRQGMGRAVRARGDQCMIMMCTSNSNDFVEAWCADIPKTHGSVDSAIRALQVHLERLVH